jgi:hypothetical protein
MREYMRAAAMRKGVFALLACASLVVATPAAFAQSRTLAEIADYQGPDAKWSELWHKTVIRPQ